MERYCKKCKRIYSHCKAGWSSNRQIWRCDKCHTRQTEQSEPSGKKKSLTTTVAVRLNENDLKILDACPGGNRSKKLRFAIKNQPSRRN